MTGIQSTDLPDIALSKPYQEKGGYTDCFYIDVPRNVTFEQYIEAFYTTRFFKAERHLLSWFARRPSTDEEARELAVATRDQFAAWSVEGRAANQILMCDYMSKTRSWLMTEDLSNDTETKTRLYFGSVVVPSGSSGKEASFGFLFHALSGFHLVYSKALLKSAYRSLAAGN